MPTKEEITRRKLKPAIINELDINNCTWNRYLSLKTFIQRSEPTNSGHVLLIALF